MGGTPQTVTQQQATNQNVNQQTAQTSNLQTQQDVSQNTNQTAAQQYANTTQGLQAGQTQANPLAMLLGTNVLGGASNLGTNNPYPGEQIANLTPQQIQSINALYSQGTGLSPLINQGAGNIGQGAGMISASGQPLSQAAINSFYNPMAANVTAQMQNIFGEQNAQNTSNAINAAGGVGADRIAVAQGDVANQQALAAGQTYANLYGQALTAAQQQQQQQLAAGTGLVNTGTGAINTGMSGLGTAYQAGSIPQQQQQAVNTAAYQQALGTYQNPFAVLQAQTGALSGLTGLGGTNIGTTTGQQAGTQTGQQTGTMTGSQTGTQTGSQTGSVTGTQLGTGQQTTTYPAPSLLTQLGGLGVAGVGTAGALGSLGYKPFGSALGGRIPGYQGGGGVPGYQDGGAALNDKYLNAIKGFEGYSARPQWDYKQWSSGYGTRASGPNDVQSRDVLEQRFQHEIGNAADTVDSAFPGLPSGPRAALTSLTYNAGPGWMNNSRLTNAVNAGDWNSASALMQQYNTAGGKQLSGLVSRRATEAGWMQGKSPEDTEEPNQHESAGLPWQAEDLANASIVPATTQTPPSGLPGPVAAAAPAAAPGGGGNPANSLALMQQGLKQATPQQPQVNPIQMPQFNVAQLPPMQMGMPQMAMRQEGGAVLSDESPYPLVGGQQYAMEDTRRIVPEGAGRAGSGGGGSAQPFVPAHHTAALLKDPRGLAQYARENGLSDAQVRAVMDEGYSSGQMANKQFQMFLDAKPGLQKGGRISGYQDGGEAAPIGLGDLPDEDTLDIIPEKRPTGAMPVALAVPGQAASAAPAGLPQPPRTAPLPPSSASSPWLALMQAGLGTAAAAGQRDARGLPMSGLSAIGVGGMQGVNVLEQQRQQARQDAQFELSRQQQQFNAAMSLVPYSQMTAEQKEQNRLKQEGLDIQRQRYGSGLFDQDTVHLMAEQALQGDKSVFSNLGRGIAGPQNIVQVRNEMNRLARERGMSGGEVAAMNANFTAQSAAARTAATREANIQTSVEEAKRTFPMAIEASNNVPRTQWVPWNKAVQMYRQGTSSPELGAFAVATQGAITAYSQAMSRIGVNTVHSQQRAEELLSTVTSHDALVARLGQMDKEMDAALAAPEATRQAILAKIAGKKIGEPLGTESKAAALGKPAAPAKAIPDSAVKHLRDNPKLRDDFDAKYGKGSAAQALGEGT